MRGLIQERVDEFAAVRSPEARLVTVPGIVGLDGMTGAAGALRLQVDAKRRLRPLSVDHLQRVRKLSARPAAARTDDLKAGHQPDVARFAFERAQQLRPVSL